MNSIHLELEQNVLNSESECNLSSSVDTNTETLGSVQLEDVFTPPTYSTFELTTTSLDNTNVGKINDEKTLNLRQQIAIWSVQENIKHSSLDKLLDILRPHVSSCELPMTGRTLLKTPTVYKTTKRAGGEYFYFGLKKYLVSLKNHNLENVRNNTLEISMSVDGLPLYKNSRRQFWPLLISFERIHDPRPRLVALFLGKKKPSTSAEYLQPFIDEFKSINCSGIWIQNQMFSLKVACVIADAPARSFLKCTTLFNGYDGCDRCCEKGVYMGRVVFPNSNSEKRTNERFSMQVYNGHQVGISPLLELNVGCVTDVVLDYMHLCCLGVMRKLLQSWCKGPLTPYKLSSGLVLKLSSRLIEMRNFIPSEFNRKSRSLDELDTWKATEFRTFLLYLGPLVLIDVLDQAKYNNFLKFSIAVRILLSNNRSWYAYAEQLLSQFFEEIGKLYSEKFWVYNVHSLLHLVDDAKRFGSLDGVSAFKFENYMQTLKRMVRSRANELAQVVVVKGFGARHFRRDFSNKYEYLSARYKT